jgi:hypothetical protein
LLFISKEYISGEKRKEVRKMTGKIAFLTLLVILAMATIVITTTVALNQTPSIESIKTNIGEESSNYITLSSEVQLQGFDKPGGWG